MVITNFAQDNVILNGKKVGHVQKNLRRNAEQYHLINAQTGRVVSHQSIKELEGVWNLKHGDYRYSKEINILVKIADYMAFIFTLIIKNLLQLTLIYDLI